MGGRGSTVWLKRHHGKDDEGTVKTIFLSEPTGDTGGVLPMGGHEIFPVKRTRPPSSRVSGGQGSVIVVSVGDVKGPVERDGGTLRKDNGVVDLRVPWTPGSGGRTPQGLLYKTFNVVKLGPGQRVGV